MADIDKLLNDIALEEEKHEEKDWYCEDCEHGPMMETETHCSRCGVKHSHGKYDEELTGWEDEDIESEVEEIW